MGGVQEVTDLIDRIHSVLLHYDSQLSASEKARADLENYKQLSTLKVEDHHNKIQTKLGERKEQVMSDISAWYHKQLEKLQKTETVNKLSMELMQDVRKLKLALHDESKIRDIDLGSIRTRIDQNGLRDIHHEDLKLHFHPSIKLNKLKKVDFGYLQVSDLLPDDLTLVLQTPISNVVFGSKVTCTVLSSKEFTNTNQDHITFAIKNKSSGVRETVSFVKEDCGVSEDKKKFNITFRVYRPGTYAVTVYLYRELHITNSPMSIPLENLSTQVQPSSVLTAELTSQMGDMVLNKGLTSRSLRRPHSQLLVPHSLNPQSSGVPSPRTPNSPNNMIDMSLQPATPKTPAGVMINDLYSMKPNNQQPLTPFTEASNNLMGLIGKEPSFGYNHLIGLNPPTAYSGPPAPVGTPLQSLKLDFKVGDKVVAKAPQTGQFYEATVFLIQESSAVVLFKESGRSDSVPFSDIQRVTASRDQSTQEKNTISNHTDTVQRCLSRTDISKKPVTSLKTSIDMSIKQPKATHVPVSQKTSTSPIHIDFERLSAGAILKGKCVLKISESKLLMAIGMTVLHDNTIVISDSHQKSNCVKMFDATGKFLRNVKAGQPFVKPSDAVTLKSGNFAVRDDFGIQVFSQEGDYLCSCGSNKIDKCFGLAEDDQGRLVTLNWSNPRGSGNGKGGGGLTSKGETDVFFINVKDGQVVKRIELGDIIQDKRNSKCRFLCFNNGKLYITDLGLDCVYVLDPVTNDVKPFGATGSGVGQFKDPAGLVCDDIGNMIVVDSKNHRLQLFNKENKVVCPLALDVPVRRPAGAHLHNGDLYVLNLHGPNGMTKYKLG